MQGSFDDQAAKESVNSNQNFRRGANMSTTQNQNGSQRSGSVGSQAAPACSAHVQESAGWLRQQASLDSLSSEESWSNFPEFNSNAVHEEGSTETIRVYMRAEPVNDHVVNQEGVHPTSMQASVQSGTASPSPRPNLRRRSTRRHGVVAAPQVETLEELPIAQTSVTAEMITIQATASSIPQEPTTSQVRSAAVRPPMLRVNTNPAGAFSLGTPLISLEEAQARRAAERDAYLASIKATDKPKRNGSFRKLAVSIKKGGQALAGLASPALKKGTSSNNAAQQAKVTTEQSASVPKPAVRVVGNADRDTRFSDFLNVGAMASTETAIHEPAQIRPDQRDRPLPPTPQQSRECLCDECRRERGEVTYGNTSHRTPTPELTHSSQASEHDWENPTPPQENGTQAPRIDTPSISTFAMSSVPEASSTPMPARPRPSRQSSRISTPLVYSQYDAATNREINRLYDLTDRDPDDEDAGTPTVDTFVHGSHVSLLITDRVDEDTVESHYATVQRQDGRDGDDSGPDAAEAVWRRLQETSGGAIRPSLSERRRR